MYRNGYYVKKDFAKFSEIISDLYEIYRDTDDAFDPLPEICIRLAAVREYEGRKDEAVSLLLNGKRMLVTRISYSHFFGDLSIMEAMVNDLYRLKELDRTSFDLYDLYYLMKEPVKVSFSLAGENFTVISVREDNGTMSVCINGKWYYSLTDALMNFRNKHGIYITNAPWEIKDFTVI